MRSRPVALAAALAALPFTYAVAQTDNWPTRAIKIIVPLTPGGSNDFIARLFAEQLQPRLGQPVVVENKPGAGGNVGTEFVARQPADGYTILISTNTHVLNVNFFAKLPYDPIKDFEPISLIATIPFVLAVNASLPAKTVNEFVTLAKVKPGSFTYGTAGIGTAHQLAAELLKARSGIDMVHVPYKGAAGIVPALLASEITCTIGAINSLLPHFRSGKLRPLAVAAATRTSLLPDVPTIAEAGPFPDYAVDIWLGVLAPAGTPRAIVDRLNVEINRIIRDPLIMKDRLNPIGLESVGTTPERYMEIMKADLVRYAKLVKDAKIKVE
ncbi:MAG: tripartite tricarboxylate transporter substrate binding protein [Betaproteobacteria bacterium]|nr:tripartite tricarboxylate transporter substrate binding protein [Betaproteobacteria bacterium]